MKLAQKTAGRRILWREGGDRRDIRPPESRGLRPPVGHEPQPAVLQLRRDGRGLHQLYLPVPVRRVWGDELHTGHRLVLQRSPRPGRRLVGGGVFT